MQQVVFQNRRRPFSRIQHHAQRAGLSLMEVLLALALSSLLLTAVYSAVSLYFQMSHSGNKEMERTQLARVVLNQMERDLRSIVYRPDEAVATDSTSTDTTSGSSSSSSTEDSTSTVIEVQDPADAYGGSASGLYGDATSLVLHVSRPSLKPAAEAAQVTTAGPTSDLKTVAYFMAGQGSGSLQAAVGAKLAASGKSDAKGLARMEGDRLTLQNAEKQGNTSALVSSSDVMAEEVASLQFRYFDGTTWYPSWDSAANGGLPQAVEITVQIQFADTTKGAGLRKKTISDVSRSYRHVVALPLAASYLQANVDANTSTVETEE